MRNTILAAAVAGALGMAGAANAGPLNPSLLTNGAGDFIGDFAKTCVIGINKFSCIAGEGALVNAFVGLKGIPIAGKTVPDTAVQHLDWIVVHDGNGNGGYTYYYQLENSSIAELGEVSIGGKAGGFLPFAKGSGKADATIDLDLLAGNPAGAAHGDPAGALPPGQDAGPFDNLFPPRTALTGGVQNGDGKAEFEFATQLSLVGPTGAAVTPGNGALLAVFLPGLFPDSESGVFSAQGTRPVYGSAVTSGTPFIWSTDFPNRCTGPNGDGKAGLPPIDGDPASCEQGIRVPVPGNAVVPEPASLLLLSGGLLALGAYTRRRRKV